MRKTKGKTGIQSSLKVNEVLPDNVQPPNAQNDFTPAKIPQLIDFSKIKRVKPLVKFANSLQILFLQILNHCNYLINKSG